MHDYGVPGATGSPWADAYVLPLSPNDHLSQAQGSPRPAWVTGKTVLRGNRDFPPFKRAMAGLRQDSRLQKKSIFAFYHGYAVTTSSIPSLYSGRHRVTKVGKHATVTKVAEDCIICKSTHPTRPSQPSWIWNVKTLCQLKKEKNQQIHHFQPQNHGYRFFNPPPPPRTARPPKREEQHLELWRGGPLGSRP